MYGYKMEYFAHWKWVFNFPNSSLDTQRPGEQTITLFFQEYLKFLVVMTSLLKFKLQCFFPLVFLVHLLPVSEAGPHPYESRARRVFLYWPSEPEERMMFHCTLPQMLTGFGVVHPEDKGVLLLFTLKGDLG